MNSIYNVLCNIYNIQKYCIDRYVREGKIIPFRATQDTSMTGDVLYISPLITNNFTLCVLINTMNVTSIHSVDQQRNSPPKDVA